MSDVFDYDWGGSSDPFEYEGDLADSGYWGDDSIEFDLESWNDDWESDFDFSIDTSFGYDFGGTDPYALEGILADNKYYESDDKGSWWQNNAVRLGLEDETNWYGEITRDEDWSDKLGKLLGNKYGMGLLGMLGQGAFGAWQEEQSAKRADELADKKFQQEQELMKLAASLKKSGGGGGRKVGEDIAPKSGAQTDVSMQGDFTKRK